MRQPGPASARPGRKRWGAISRPRPCSTSAASWTTGPRSRSRSRRSCRAHKKSTRRDRRVNCQSTLIGLARQRDVGAAELAIGTHRDVLLVAGRLQRDVGVEAGGGGEQLIVSTRAAARKGAADIAAGLGPAARDGAAFSLYVGAEVELVGVAGAGQRQLHRRSDRSVFGPAADPRGDAPPPWWVGRERICPGGGSARSSRHPT